MNEPECLYEYVEADSFEIHSIPEKMSSFLEFWKSKFELIPEEYRDSTTIDFQTYDEYGSIGTEVCINYMIKKSKEQLEQEQLEQEKKLERKKQKEYEEYLRLKEKFKDIVMD